MTIFTLLSLVSPQAAEAFKFADATKDLVMELVFTDNRDLRAERRELSGYTLNYVSWLADVLLHCEQAEQAGLIDAFFKSADLIRNDNSKYLITELIRIQDICGKTDAFWNIWELLKPYLLALSSKPQVSFDDRQSVWTGQSDYQLFIWQFSLEIRRSPMRLPSRRKSGFL